MSEIFLSHRAGTPLLDHLIALGHTPRLIEDDGRFGKGLESHADLRLCAVGGRAVFFEGDPLPRYPENAAFCAVVLDGFLIHRLDITAPGLRNRCRELGLREIHVRQGYTKCSCVLVDGRSLITSDPGICAALSEVPELRVLKVRAGAVRLPGFDTGFIGGASGRVGDEVIFNGDLSSHPDFGSICDFIVSRGLKVRFFPDYELTDIGSIIEIRRDSV